MGECDCGAATEGRWADVHTKDCASLTSEPTEIDKATISLAAVADRLEKIAAMDGPPSLIVGEVKIIRRRIDQIRAAAQQR